MSNPEPVFDHLDSPRPSKSQARAARRAKKRAATNLIAPPLAAKTPRQRVYIDALRRGESAFAVGPAGVGKTYIPARIAAQALLRGTISKIVITRVTASAKRHALGFLPGKADQKMAPWLVPVFDGLRAEMNAVTLEKFRQEQRIEIVPFEHMRGRSFHDCWIIFDEAQNANIADLKLFLTRVGENAQVVVAGDVEQIDIEDSGLLDVIRIAECNAVPMRVVRFRADDVVRSEFTKAWVKAFAADSALKNGSPAVNLDAYPAFLHNTRTVMKSGTGD